MGTGSYFAKLNGGILLEPYLPGSGPAVECQSMLSLSGFRGMGRSTTPDSVQYQAAEYIRTGGERGLDADTRFATVRDAAQWGEAFAERPIEHPAAPAWAALEAAGLSQQVLEEIVRSQMAQSNETGGVWGASIGASAAWGMALSGTQLLFTFNYRQLLEVLKP